ncbi:putative histidinol dehydrogenase [Phaeomoniella chlamydospora]|uniref:Putative histidinol dehydrogenase n=1 Tax=Phaeomoniella chlamydospora TaxID=158046 RepID=A0A0G2GXS8_PHACM|nr:putative histidinol dehydrogenase [Phaeomoniella chlamydospora]
MYHLLPRSLSRLKVGQLAIIRPLVKDSLPSITRRSFAYYPNLQAVNKPDIYQQLNIMPRYLKSVKHSIATKQAPPSTHTVPDVVKGVIQDIRNNGDAAVRQYSEKFDKWSPPSFRLSQTDIDAAIAACPEQTIKDIKEVQHNVRTFAQAQRDSIKDFELEIQPGVFLGQKNNPLNRVGAYIPGGRYPLLASAHMTILTAKVAGVKHVIGCTPPIAGEIPNATIAAMHLAGADEIYLLGGVQAVAAMAIGTETIPRVDFLAGPGNAFVAEAKRQLFGEVGIDLFAGPTEILVVADETADPYTIAVDLLSQAEHGPDTPAVLVTNSEKVGKESIEWVDELLKILPTAPIASQSWQSFGEVIVAENMDEAYLIADDIASEHVEILTKNPREALDKMTNYGALFLGHNTCVSYGDKCIGTNHVLPTRKAARYTGGLWVGKYLRTVTYQEVQSDEASGKLGQLCGRSARAENFEGHARSGDLRAYHHLKDKIDWIEESLGGAAETNGVNGVH